MKKKMLALLLSLSLILGLSAPCFAAETPDPATAYASTQTVLVDGQPVTFEAYALKDENGNDTNYVKLRDLAQVLNGTAAQFEVDWDGSVQIKTAEAYTPNGTEMATPYEGNRAYEPAVANTKVDGALSGLDAILLKDDNGNGYTYYKLRDLGKALGFNVDWNPQDGIVLQAEKEPAADSNVAEFVNLENHIIEDAKVSIRPRNVYWEDGKLYAQCFVLNGFDDNVYNIDVNRLAFSMPDGTVIADGCFGRCSGLKVAPRSYAVWTFIFHEDTVQTPNADLSTLHCECSVGADHDSNFFLNDNNNIYETGKVSIRPQYVRWVDGMLVADCFVINGLDTQVSNLDVTNLEFRMRDDTLIAQGSFGTLNGVTLGSHEHVIWTFRFLPRAVYRSGTDLSFLRCISDVGFDY